MNTLPSPIGRASKRNLRCFFFFKEKRTLWYIHQKQYIARVAEEKLPHTMGVQQCKFLLSAENVTRKLFFIRRMEKQN
nr:MAG TPA: hypothetical protein [Caudoviricetes sp.]